MNNPLSVDIFGNTSHSRSNHNVDFLGRQKSRDNNSFLQHQRSQQNITLQPQNMPQPSRQAIPTQQFSNRFSQANYSSSHREGYLSAEQKPRGAASGLALPVPSVDRSANFRPGELRGSFIQQTPSHEEYQMGAKKQNELGQPSDWRDVNASISQLKGLVSPRGNIEVSSFRQDNFQQNTNSFIGINNTQINGSRLPTKPSFLRSAEATANPYAYPIQNLEEQAMSRQNFELWNKSLNDLIPALIDQQLLLKKSQLRCLPKY